MGSQFDPRYQVAPLGYSHQSARTRVLNMFDTKFRTSTADRRAKYPKNFLELSEDTACDAELYTDFTKFLMDEYKIESGEYLGKALSCDTVLNYLGILVNHCKNQHGVSASDRVK